MSMIAVGAGIGAVGSIASGVIGANAASSAADQQAAAAQEANRIQQEQFAETNRIQKEARDQGRADLDPWRTSGVAASGKMNDADFQRDFSAGDFQTDPGYQFRMAEGQKALERSAAARGGLQSGGMMKALAQYGQGVASEEYGNAYNRFNADRDRRFGRLSQISGQGLSAAGSMAGVGGNYASAMGQASQNYAGNVGSNLMGSAKAAGNAGMAQAGAVGDAISGVVGAGQDWMSKWKANQGK